MMTFFTYHRYIEQYLNKATNTKIIMIIAVSVLEQMLNQIFLLSNLLYIVIIYLHNFNYKILYLCIHIVF